MLLIVKIQLLKLGSNIDTPFYTIPLVGIINNG